MKKILVWSFLTFVFLPTFFITPVKVNAETESPLSDQPVVYLFGRDDCSFCKEEADWLQEEGIEYEYLNIVSNEQAREWYLQVTKMHEISMVTPITVVGQNVFAGFNGSEVTGGNIISALEESRSSEIISIEDHLNKATKQDILVSGGGCSGISCSIGEDKGYIFELPIFGIVDLKSFSLFSLSAILGVIDGFNPCAMWVLITFLVILSQAGSKKKMVFLAGLFIFAEAIMYNLILNVWYKTWNFVALDQYVTPLVGLLALGGGSFFLWRWYKNRDAGLVCDITDIETQSKTINKFKAIVNQPITIATVFAILVIAFSVNIIEFACSIGIPQAYTKILDLNMLSFLEQQWYIFIYTTGYMVDDFIVFGLAIWGYSKIQAHGGKYSQLSLLFGGILMLILGSILVLNPTFLVLQ